VCNARRTNSRIRERSGMEASPGLRRAGIQGRVVVQVVIDTLGRVEPGSPRGARADRVQRCPMILSHPNYDNRSFSSNSALATAWTWAAAWKRLAGPEATPQSR